MATDRRELILSRIHTLLLTCKAQGIVNVSRNRTSLTSPDLPALFLLDGDERSLLASSSRGSTRLPEGKPTNMNDLAVMIPEIYLQLEISKPHSELSGPALNLWKRRLHKLIIEDEELKALVSHPTGTMRYLSFLTSFGRGKGLDGMLQMEFEFIYPLLLREM